MSEISIPNVLAPARLRQVRKLRELKGVLYDKKCLRHLDLNLPAYEIYRDCCDNGARDLLRKHSLRYDVTVIPPLLLGEEYVKTLGHYHLPLGETCSHPEILEVLEGEAVFLVEKKCGRGAVDVSLLTAKEGEKILVPPDRGHVIINASSGRLVVGHLISRDCVQTYDPYLERGGATFYFLTGGRLVRNPNCSSTSGARVLRAETPPFLETGLSLMHTFLNDPNQLALLNDPSTCAKWGVLESAVTGVVLSSGQGSEPRPVTYYLPKDMIPIEGSQSALLDYALRLSASQNALMFLNVFLATYAALMFLTLISMTFCT